MREYTKRAGKRMTTLQTPSAGRSKKKTPPTAEQRAHMAQDYLADAEKRGELDPKHGKEFGLLLDDVAPLVAKKKK